MLTIGHFVNWVPCEVFAVAFLAFVLGTRMRIGARIGWTVVLAICCAKFWLFGTFGGNRYNPVLPAWVILILNLMFSWAAGIAATGLVWWHRRTRVWAVPVLAAVLAAIGNWNGLCLPKVREVRLVYPNLPRELEGYRIVQVSDLHASTAMRRWRTESIVKMVNALDADLICVTGDSVDGEPEVAAEFVEPIRNLRAKDGVWAITGNHEYFYSVEKWRKCYDEWGIRFFENGCVFPRKSLALGGVNDFQVCRGKFPKDWRPNVAPHSHRRQMASSACSCSTSRKMRERISPDTASTSSSPAIRTAASCRESPPSFPVPATASSEDSIQSAASFSMSRQVAANVHGCQFVSAIHRN